MISIKNLTKSYDSGTVIENVSFDIQDGECVVIIGGSGCGKSTLIRCINRLNVPDSGEIWIDGENILDPKADVDAMRRSMGMVYQHFNLFSHLNVLENIILAPMVVNKVEREEAVKEAKQLLKRVSLDGKEYNMPSSLSGGQKQRVAIARTLAMHPKFIIFDEPTSALDPTMVDEVESVIKDLANDGMTCVIVTHEMSFARNVASRVIFLAEKGIYEQGTAQEIFDNPSRPLTQRFLYRSRMFEKELLRDGLDLLSLNSELKKYVSKYDTNRNQALLINSVCDELLYPVFTS
jgi:ABC-type polar amino acid transport system ATPase subunit